MNKAFSRLAVVGLVIVVGLGLLFMTPTGRSIINTYFFNVRKVDDSTNYKIIKEVEDTCRAMISSYEADRLTYEQYKDSSKEENVSWAEQARMRANKTASSYNNYILKNSFIWEGNIPKDILSELKIVE